MKRYADASTAIPSGDALSPRPGKHSVVGATALLALLCVCSGAEAQSGPELLPADGAQHASPAPSANREPAPAAPTVVTSPADRPSRAASLPVAGIAGLVEAILPAVIPKVYEEKKDWGKTKQVVRGLRLTGRGRKLRTMKQTKAVPHGTWQQYRVVIDPEKPLRVGIADTRTDEHGTLHIRAVADAQLKVSASIRRYNRGIRILSATVEADASLRLNLQCEAALRIDRGILAPTFAIDPKITDAELLLSTFHLKKVGKLDGPLVKEASSGAKGILQKQIEKRKPKLLEQLNKAVDRQRDRLTFSADEIARSQWSDFWKTVKDVKREQEEQPTEGGR